MLEEFGHYFAGHITIYSVQVFSNCFRNVCLNASRDAALIQSGHHLGNERDHPIRPSGMILNNHVSDAAIIEELSPQAYGGDIIEMPVDTSLKI